MNIWFKSLWMLVFSVFSICALADNSGPARIELERFTSGLERFHSEFTQAVRSQDGRVQDQTQGEVWLQSPDKLRWVYTGEFPETIVADGNNIWIYDESLQQVFCSLLENHLDSRTLVSCLQCIHSRKQGIHHCLVTNLSTTLLVHFLGT